MSFRVRGYDLLSSSRIVSRTLSRSVDVGVCYPQQVITQPLERLCAALIALWFFVCRMGATIHLNDQLGIKADEVDEISTDWVLPANFPAR